MFVSSDTCEDGSVVSLILILTPGCTYLEGTIVDENAQNSEEIGPVMGCTDANANNYNETATEDDGSCEYDEPEPEPEPIKGY